tara:strand:+ start:72 stop:704 length:633 start_codon:yes stop_codon:yes gene_type:complete
MSEESYNVIMDTLSMDLDSSFIDSEIKEDIEKAVNDTRIISSSKSVNPYVKDGFILVSNCCKSEALYRVSEKYGFDLYEYCPQCLELCGWDVLEEAEDKHVYGSETVDPESMPTCEGCGGQKEHPTKEFSYPPENGLCAMELDECEVVEDEQIEDYSEGDNCPFCDSEYNEFFTETEGGGHHDFIRHNYECSECGKEWYNESVFKTYEVK